MEKRKFAEISIKIKLDGRRIKNNGEQWTMEIWSNVYEEREDTKGK